MTATHFDHYGSTRDDVDERDFAYAPPTRALPASVDLRPGCGGVYSQGTIKSCSAHALASALVFLEKKDARRVVLPSRLFMYYNARKLNNTEASDSGATIRSAIKALNAAGACDETLWPYDTTKFALEPPRECYAHATMHALRYYRLAQDTLVHAKSCLADGYPFVFGVEIFHGPCRAATATGHMTMPDPTDTPIAGHAVMAVGYDDATQTLMVLNSEGTSWGLDGYFTMPYAYITNSDLTFDLWTIRAMG